MTGTGMIECILGAPAVAFFESGNIGPSLRNPSARPIAQCTAGSGFPRRQHIDHSSVNSPKSPAHHIGRPVRFSAVHLVAQTTPECPFISS